MLCGVCFAGSCFSTRPLRRRGANCRSNMSDARSVFIAIYASQLDRQARQHLVTSGSLSRSRRRRASTASSRRAARHARRSAHAGAHTPTQRVRSASGQRTAAPRDVGGASCNRPPPNRSAPKQGLGPDWCVRSVLAAHSSPRHTKTLRHLKRGRSHPSAPSRRRRGAHALSCPLSARGSNLQS